jgi:beta-N-acetylhexosaminidase
MVRWGSSVMRRILWPLWALGFAGLVLACGSAVSSSRSSSGQRERPARAHLAPVRPHASRAGASASPHLTALQQAGQRVVFSYVGLAPPASLLSAVRAGEVGGVIVFAPNISSAAQLRGVAARLQAASLASPLHDRLLIATDQEGGLVRRLPGGPASSERAIGRSPDPVRSAATAGRAAASAMRAAGLNVNLAPVLDVYRSPGNFIDQYGRAYSSSAPLAGSLGAAFIAAQQRAGVAATAKHFPGLGAAATAQNTDLDPVTLRLGSAALRSVDEAPYRPAIAAGVKLVMTSWATYPALDPAHPAGMSPAIIGGELRRRLGFRGVTITDAIGAGALARFGSLGARAVRAAAAGADLILCSQPNPLDNSVALDLSVVRALGTAIARGQVSAANTRAALGRLLALRRTL